MAASVVLRQIEKEPSGVEQSQHLAEALVGRLKMAASGSQSHEQPVSVFPYKQVVAISLGDFLEVGVYVSGDG